MIITRNSNDGERKQDAGGSDDPWGGKRVEASWRRGDRDGDARLLFAGVVQYLGPVAGVDVQVGLVRQQHVARELREVPPPRLVLAVDPDAPREAPPAAVGVHGQVVYEYRVVVDVVAAHGDQSGGRGRRRE